MTVRRRVAARLGVAVAAALLAATALGSTSRVQIAARLTPGQESPPQQVHNLKASGTFLATVHPGSDGYRLVWKLTFARLRGVAMSADVHHGSPGNHGAAVIHLCSPCRSGATGAAYFSQPEVVLARAGLLYVNVRTARNPAGEIRGQLRLSSRA
jgi:hypothetical protein